MYRIIYNKKENVNSRNEKDLLILEKFVDYQIKKIKKAGKIDYECKKNLTESKYSVKLCLRSREKNEIR